MPVYDDSPTGQAPEPAPTVDAKIVIAGGFGVGKTTLVKSVSEITPLTTEETLTSAGTEVDDLAGIEAKTATTVAMDFGRITLTTPRRQMVLYLYGTPGQERFLFTWDDLSYGAIGAVVLVDTRRLADAFVPVEFFEHRMPFVVAVNEFEGALYRYHPEEVRTALEIPPDVPVRACDARDRHSAAGVLEHLLMHALAVAEGRTHRRSLTATTALGART